MHTPDYQLAHVRHQSRLFLVCWRTTIQHVRCLQAGLELLCSVLRRQYLLYLLALLQMLSSIQLLLLVPTLHNHLPAAEVSITVQ